MENIKDAFVKTDPEHKQYYENNYKAWSDECDRLYNEYQEALNQVKTKNLVVSHEAFGYLRRRCSSYNRQSQTGFV